MRAWTHLAELASEAYQRLWVDTTSYTEDQEVQQRYLNFLDELYPKILEAEQKLKEKLLASGIEPPVFERPLLNLRTEAVIYREKNLPLLTEELKLSNDYDQLIGAQTVLWEGEEITLPVLQMVHKDPDRERREQAWRLGMQRWLQDRQAINDLWKQSLDLRCRLATNAGMADYREYRWRQLLRHDYTPADCRQFQEAIEQVAVPAASQLYERRRQRLGLQALRPWDLEVDPYGLPPLQPFIEVADLDQKVQKIFNHVDPELGQYYRTMRQEGLLDLDNRKGKAPGGYCTEFAHVKRPFIFMNAVGVQDDVQTLIHEGGHAFHIFETIGLPYIQQRTVGIEIAEVASIGMELLAAPYLSGIFYDDRDAARARIEFLETAMLFWPYMAVVDAFQHWVYTHPRQAEEPQACDATWVELWERFMPGVDWSGLDVEKATGWQRKLHIHQVPFYYVEYGLAQLGAFQVWQHARQDQAGAVRAYRKALSMGGTASLPELFAAAGARFAFDAATLQSAIDLGMDAIRELEGVIQNRTEEK
jgi:oligoendopeptidase F